MILDTVPPLFPQVLDMSRARELLGEDYKVVSVIGDGAMTGGMAYEALNNAPSSEEQFHHCT